jgi:lipoprotein signal peptidase
MAAGEVSWWRRVGVRLGWFVGSSVLGSGCDLQTKAWAERTLADLPGRAMMAVEPWLELSLQYNRGTAFSLVRDLGTARVVFGVLAIVVVVALLVMVLRGRQNAAESVSLGAIAGGAIGNGFDRAFRVGPAGESGVVDFIRINYPWGGSWPTFNIADALVACGVIGLGLARLWQRRRPPPADGDVVQSTAPSATASP